MSLKFVEILVFDRHYDATLYFYMQICTTLCSILGDKVMLKSPQMEYIYMVRYCPCVVCYYGMLHPMYSMLLPICRMLFPIYDVLLSMYGMLLPYNGVLLPIYGILFPYMV